MKRLDAPFEDAITVGIYSGGSWRLIVNPVKFVSRLASPVISVRMEVWAAHLRGTKPTPMRFRIPYWPNGDQWVYSLMHGPQRDEFTSSVPRKLIADLGSEEMQNTLRMYKMLLTTQ